jgi:23S rRNA (guanine1835-N2)-methyltransferase
MSQVELNGELFTLERFPPNAEEEALQAWEAADEYLLQQVNDVDGLTLIFNDSFGALGCALAERNPVSINDSYVSELATRHNLRMNGIDEESVRFQDPLSELPAAPALVLIKVPKQLALLEQQLRALRGLSRRKPASSPPRKRGMSTTPPWRCLRRSSAPPPHRWHGKRRG